MAQRILGLDLGQSIIKGVVLQQTLRSFEIVGFHSEMIAVEPSEDNEELYRSAVHAAIRQIIEHLAPIDQIITSISGEWSASNIIEFPFSEPSQIALTLPHQLDEVSPFDIEDLHYDYQFIERSKEGAKLLVASLPKERFAAYLEHLQEAEIDPRVVMMDGLPYHFLFENVTEPPVTGTWGVLDIGFSHTTLTIFRKVIDEKGKESIRCESTRSLARGTKHLQKAIFSSFECTFEQAAQILQQQTDFSQALAPNPPQTTQVVLNAFAPLLTEIRRTLAAIQRREKASIDTLYITGGGAALIGIIPFLSQKLNLQVQLLATDQLPVAEDLEWPKEQEFQYLKALSLALRSIKHTRYSQINLRKGPFVFKGDLQFLKERAGSIVFGVSILLILFIISVVSRFYVLAHEEKYLAQKAEQQCRKILGRSISDPNRCLLIMLDEIQKVRGNNKNALIPRISAYDIFLEVYDRIAKLTKSQKIKVEIGTLRITPKRFELEGETDSYGSVDKIEKQLKGYRCFEKIHKGQVRQTTGAVKKIEFRLWAELSC